MDPSVWGGVVGFVRLLGTVVLTTLDREKRESEVDASRCFLDKVSVVVVLGSVTITGVYDLGRYL